MIATLILGVALMGQNRPDYPRHHGQGLALAGQKQPYMDWFSELDGDFLQVPITLQRSIPLEAIDLEIRQQRSMVHEKQRVLDAARQLTRRGAIDPYVLEQATAEYRFHKTQEGERIAYRALEGYERDTSGGAIAPDSATAYTLLLDWLKRREAMAAAKAEFRSFQLARLQDLDRRDHVRYWDRVECQLDLDEARAEAALSRAQQEWANLGKAAWTGAATFDARRWSQGKLALRQAGLRCSEARVARDNLLLDMIQVARRSRRPLPSVTPQSLILLLKVAHDDALVSLAGEARRLAELEIEKADPEHYALAWRRSIEADDLDRAIRRQHHAVLRLKAYLDTAHRLAGRDAVGPAELEHVTALVRYHEAMEAERIACRALMVQDRDARGWAIPADGEREYALVLDWTTRKRDMAQVKADWHVSRLAQDRKLFGCKAISRANWVISCRELHAARAEVALHEAECARVAWKLAALRGRADVEPAALLRIRIASGRAHVRYLETRVAAAKSHLDPAEEMSRRELITGIELGRLRDIHEGTSAVLTFAQGRQDRLEAEGEHHREFLAELEQLAYFLRLRWDHQRARRLYEHTLALRKVVPGDDRPESAATLVGLASVCGATGDLVGAEPLLRQASEILKRAVGEEHPFYAESLGQLASIYQLMGDTAQAKALRFRELEVFKKVYGEGHPSYARCLDDLVLTYCVAGDYGRAEPLAQQAAETFKTAVGEAHPYYAMGLHRLAWVRTLRGDYKGAEPLARQALELRKPDLGRSSLAYVESLRALARVERGKGNLAGAEPLLRQALEIAERVLGKSKPECSLELRDLADLYYLMGDDARAESLVLQAIAIDRQSVELTSAGQSERQQLRMIGKLRSSLDLYLSVAPRVHSDNERVYREVLAWKGTVFAHQQAIRLARSRPDNDPEVGRLVGELGQVTSRLASLVFSTEDLEHDRSWRQKIQQLTEEKEQLEKDLSSRSSAFAGQQKLWRLSPAELRAAVPPGTALVDILEYRHFEPTDRGKGKMSAEGRVVAFVVRPDRPIARIDLGPAAAIVAAVGRWRAAFVEDRPAAATGSADPAGELRRLVWQPLEPSLSGIRAVLFSPDGALARFPLAALPGRNPDTYLIEEFPIAIVPVPQLLARPPSDTDGAGDASRAPLSLLVLGDIDFGGVPDACPPAGPRNAGALASRAGRLLRFPPLPGTTREMKQVCATFHQTNPAGVVEEVRGAGATKAVFTREAPGKRFLHLATHGFFAPPELRSALRPAVMADALGESGPAERYGPDSVIGFHPGLLSGLALAGANRDAKRGAEDAAPGDGILTALEVAELDLSHADLVMLSGCETGLGRPSRGEGLLGLQRAFQVAGARTVVASLWKVDDDATQRFMSDFYLQLWERHLTPIEALRQAQLHMLNGACAAGRPRGVGPPQAAPVGPRRARAHPRFWAAWVLSGYPGA